ncbi:acyl carrier protein [Mitosporidium daphniae]|uniref:Acid phosphomonoesterase n=1 Tax=Mitosporidium daphniae TaxID=1485682 RepID=A0A098VSN8_9MICR|nr:acid phosphomonoesterase [Mitosporidium daphniae]KGG51799.1 acid phosphomonoesterase [Mitosporidium daphniae]|eukprot:XP_013238235.1 acid phosphomonoesterase [Mitosporidium daphniae]
MNVLVLCLGNICRSPLAASMLEAYVKNNFPESAPQISFYSAGTYSHTKGQKADSRSIEVAVKNENIVPGVSSILSLHRARPVTIADITLCDYILVMDLSNLAKVRAIIEKNSSDQNTVNALMKKVFLFGNFCKENFHDNEEDHIIIKDPWYGSSSDFDTVYHQCHLATKRFISYLRLGQ